MKQIQVDSVNLSPVQEVERIETDLARLDLARLAVLGLSAAGAVALSAIPGAFVSVSVIGAIGAFVVRHLVERDVRRARKLQSEAKVLDEDLSRRLKQLARGPGVVEREANIAQ